MVIDFKSLRELQQWGRDFAKELGDRDVVFLNGPMGAGKTTLVTAISVGYGVEESEVTSPTFALHNHMINDKGQSVHHLDGYRIETPQEYEQVGLDMLPEGLTFIEWPDKCQLLRPTITINFEIGEGEERRLIVSHA